MEWKDSNLDFTKKKQKKNCIFIDEARFHTNLRNDWARSNIGTLATVKTPKTKAPLHTTIGATYVSKGTTIVHFIKFINGLLDIMNLMKT